MVRKLPVMRLIRFTRGLMSIIRVSTVGALTRLHETHTPHHIRTHNSVPNQKFWVHNKLITLRSLVKPCLVKHFKWLLKVIKGLRLAKGTFQTTKDTSVAQRVLCP